MLAAARRQEKRVGSSFKETPLVAPLPPLAHSPVFPSPLVAASAVSLAFATQIQTLTLLRGPSGQLHGQVVTEPLGT